jgi:DNA-binding IscR family transcriptional regulator
MRIDGCVTHLLWKSLGEKIEAFLYNMTLQDLIEGQQPVKITAKKNKIERQERLIKVSV